MGGNNHSSRNSSPNHAPNNANRRTPGGRANEADAGVSLAKAVIELNLELREGFAYLVERGVLGEGVLLSIEVGEGLEGPIALVLRDGGGRRRKVFDEFPDRDVEGSSLIDGFLEEEAEGGCVLAAVEVVGDEAGELGGEGEIESPVDGIAIGVEHLRRLAERGVVDSVPYLIVGGGLDGDRVCLCQV